MLPANSDQLNEPQENPSPEESVYERNPLDIVVDVVGTDHGLKSAMVHDLFLAYEAYCLVTGVPSGKRGLEVARQQSGSVVRIPGDEFTLREWEKIIDMSSLLCHVLRDERLEWCGSERAQAKIGRCIDDALVSLADASSFIQTPYGFYTITLKWNEPTDDIYFELIYHRL